MEGLQGQRRLEGDDRLFVHGIPAPSQGVLQKLHHRVQVPVNPFAVEIDVPPDAPRDVLLLLEATKRITANTLGCRCDEANEDGAAAAGHISRTHYPKVGASDLLEVVRQDFDRVLVDLGRGRRFDKDIVRSDGGGQGQPRAGTSPAAAWNMGNPAEARTQTTSRRAVLVIMAMPFPSSWFFMGKELLVCRHRNQMKAPGRYFVVPCLGQPVRCFQLPDVAALQTGDHAQLVQVQFQFDILLLVGVVEDCQ